MAVKKKTSSNIVIKPFVILFKRFHLMVFFVFIIACLAFAVILINDILTKSSDDTTGSSSTTSSTIDQATLQRIQNLHTSTNAGASPELPAGRINPFNE